MKYLDVLYTPLDVITRPEIDIDDFSDWANSVYPQECIGTESKSKYVAHDRLRDNYPWNLVYGMHAGKWKNNFEQRFCKLAEYCYQAYGLQEEHLYTVLFLPTRENFIQKTFWHTDPDSTGLRFYLSNKNHSQNLLMMRQTRREVKDLWKLNAEDAEQFLEENIMHCKILSNNQAFFLNNVHAAHSPYDNHRSEKITVFVTVKAKYTEEIIKEIVEPLVLSSANKYGDHAIRRGKWQ